MFTNWSQSAQRGQVTKCKKQPYYGNMRPLLLLHNDATLSTEYVTCYEMLQCLLLTTMTIT